jgi:hypothetical protein
MDVAVGLDGYIGRSAAVSEIREEEDFLRPELLVALSPP